MWFYIQGRIGKWEFEHYWQRPKLIHKLRYFLSKSYRNRPDDIPF